MNLVLFDCCCCAIISVEPYPRYISHHYLDELIKTFTQYRPHRYRRSTRGQKVVRIVHLQASCVQPPFIPIIEQQQCTRVKQHSIVWRTLDLVQAKYKVSIFIRTQATQDRSIQAKKEREKRRVSFFFFFALRIQDGHFLVKKKGRENKSSTVS